MWCEVEGAMREVQNSWKHVCILYPPPVVLRGWPNCFLAGRGLFLVGVILLLAGWSLFLGGWSLFLASCNLILVGWDFLLAGSCFFLTGWSPSCLARMFF